MNQHAPLCKLYEELFECYGPRGWWPLIECGYHPGDYTYPQSNHQRFEIALGAILTQNTAWGNAKRAVHALEESGLMDPAALMNAPIALVEELVRPSGYWRMKARKVKEYAQFAAAAGGTAPSRKALLAIWGIGPETADDILLYAWKEAICVVDAYTKRLFVSRGLIGEGASYDDIQTLCHTQLPQEVPLLQEFHALIVQWGKENPPSRLKKLVLA